MLNQRNIVTDDACMQGCDGSVLIDSTANNTAEKDAVPNNPSLRGFEVIDAAKTAIEARCPKTVSCADILAFAARDSVALSGNLTYKVPAGRRDGRVSRDTDANSNLPSPLSSAAELVGNFTRKNLTAEDMVVLSGAHTVGRSHCSSFTNRLYGFSNASDVDPAISSAYAFLLRSICPSNTSRFFPNTTTDMDLITPAVLDNKYYVGLTNNLGLFTSDQALLTNATLKKSVDEFVKSDSKWKSKFAKSMVKMGNIEVLTGTQGEIRLNCRVINNGSSNSAGFELRMTTDSAQEELADTAAN
jgi:peroxidase